MKQLKIDEMMIYQAILDSVYISDAKSSIEIPPYRSLERKEVSFLLPKAEPLKTRPQDTPITERILDIMLSKSVCRGKRSLISPFLGPVREKIQRLVDHNQPIGFILPTLPFKDQSPFTTGLPIDSVDFGEYAFFAQLKRILEAIKTIYPPGGHFTLLSDGYIYADIFADGDIEGAGRYKARCEKIKNEYGLYNEVTLFDMREVLFDIPEWKVTNGIIRKIVNDLYESKKEIRERLDVLASRLIYHVQLPGISYEEAREFYSQDPLPDWLSLKLFDAAIKFTTLSLTLQKTEVVSRAFPSAIRCTVHPKAAAQLPLHLTNSHNQLLPYNGVATISRVAQTKGQSLFSAVRIRRLCDVFESDAVVAIHSKETKRFLYYELP